MKTYIAILRGINVGGKNKINMEALKSSFRNLGFEKVQTYIQSGNIVFRNQELRVKELEVLINKQILEDFGFDVPVLVIDANELQNIIKNNPFANNKNRDPRFLHVTFLKSQPTTFDEEKINAHLKEGEEFSFSNGAIYLYCPYGYGKTKLNNNFFERHLKVSATTRNWKTTLKVLEMSIEIDL